MAFAMFLAATGVQFAVQELSRRAILAAGAASTTFAMVTPIAQRRWTRGCREPQPGRPLFDSSFCVV
ncbi:hypothetical protein ACIBCO_02365 [Streptomyces violascens]|uniref:hypothetical protein n=1 Tax=Streptomyces violascens TaxID=67381 RepID=UPI00378D3772